MSIVLLARYLGLSISTVSRALNGYEDAKPADIHYLEPVVLVPRKSDGPCTK